MIHIRKAIHMQLSIRSGAGVNAKLALNATILQEKKKQAIRH